MEKGDQRKLDLARELQERARREEFVELRAELEALSELPPYLTKSHAAEVLGVSTRTIERKLANGELVSRRFGKRSVRIPRESIRAYVRELIFV